MSCRTEEHLEDKQVPLTTWPRWGNAGVGVTAAWHRWNFTEPMEARCGETTEAEIVFLEPGEEMDPESVCLDCRADEERHAPAQSVKGKGTRDLINEGERLAAAAQRTAKSAASALDSTPRKTRKPKPMVCGGTSCRIEDGTEVHRVGDPTCQHLEQQASGGRQRTPKPRAIKRAAELAAQFGKTP